MIQEIETVCNQLNKKCNFKKLWNGFDSWKLEVMNEWLQNLGIPDMEIVIHVDEDELLLMNLMRFCFNVIIESYAESF